MNQQVREIYEEEMQQLAEKINEAIKRPSTLDEDIKELVIRHVSDLMVEIAKDREEKCSG